MVLYVKFMVGPSGAGGDHHVFESGSQPLELNPKNSLQKLIRPDAMHAMTVGAISYVAT